MNEFCRKLITEWRKLSLPIANETVIIAVSGGADSTALTVALDDLKKRKKLNLRFIVAHYNHNLRAEHSAGDELFVKNLTERLNLELVLGSGEISNEGNLEQNAREKRYEFLGATAENLKASVILTAHTMNDQAETFLMNLIRGSGIEGLGGIKPVRNLDSRIEISASEKLSEIKLVRPLLNWAKREDTENYCHQNEIEFCHDQMNDDLRFKRVRVRKVLLPLLKDFNPKIVENLAKTAELLRGELEADSEPETNFSEDEFSLENVRDLPKPLIYKSLRVWLRSNRGDLRRLELKHFQAIERLLFSRKSGKTVELPGGEKVYKSGGMLRFEKTKVEK